MNKRQAKKKYKKIGMFDPREKQTWKAQRKANKDVIRLYNATIWSRTSYVMLVN